MDNAGLHDIINQALLELTQIKYRDDLETAFPDFLAILQSRLKSVNGAKLGSRESLRIQELSHYTVYSDLAPWHRFWKRLVASKFRMDYAENWSEKGKYLADLDEIKLKLDSLKNRIE